MYAVICNDPCYPEPLFQAVNDPVPGEGVY